MTEKTERSEEKTDWLGNKYTQHYDSDGNKAGRSEEKTDWLGDKFTQHYDNDDNKIGRSEQKTDWLGDEYTQHYDEEGSKAGRSEEKTDWLGDEYTQHYDEEGSEAGRSEEKKDWLGDEYTQHYDRRSIRSARTSHVTQRASNSSSNSASASNYDSSRGEPDSGLAWLVLAIVVLSLLGYAAGSKMSSVGPVASQQPSSATQADLPSQLGRPQLSSPLKAPQAVAALIAKGIAIPEMGNSDQLIIAGENFANCKDATNPTGACRFGPKGDFNIGYFVSKDVFVISLSEPLNQSRVAAENYLKHVLQLDDTHMCQLNYFISTTVSVDYLFAGKDFKFSFCPDSIVLPSEPSNRHSVRMG